MANKVITRFPPSPTGFLHVGRARTALFNYLFAKRNGGSFVFRIEDTDKERSKKEYELDVIENLKWLGLEYDNKEIWRQSERSDVYQSYLKKLLDGGRVYLSKETEGDRAEVIRFKNPNKTIKFTDLIRGEISFDTTDLGDFVVAKSLTEPLYHLSVVVDDAEMGITHVIRGEDGISNTPRQILIQEALGFTRPEYAHLPLILAPDRSKLSGRHGAVSLRDYREMGYLPEAIINYLALLGWSAGDDKEIFTLAELVEKFDLSRVQKGGAMWSNEKLDWVNKEHLRKDIPNSQALISSKIKEILKLEATQKNKEILEKISPIVFERINKLGDIQGLVDRGDLQYFFSRPKYSKELIYWKDEKDAALTQKRLQSVIKLIQPIEDGNFSAESVKAAVWNFASEEGRGSVLWPMRVALSGEQKSPDPFVLAGIMEKEETIARLQKAIELLS